MNTCVCALQKGVTLFLIVEILILSLYNVLFPESDCILLDNNMVVLFLWLNELCNLCGYHELSLSVVAIIMKEIYYQENKFG